MVGIDPPRARRNVRFPNRPFRLGSSTFRLTAAAVSTSLAGPRFSSESAPRSLYGAFLVGTFRVGTTWAPRYAQPRIDPTVIEGLPARYAELANPNCDIARLLLLPDRYDAWIEDQALVDAGQGLPAEIAERERQAHAQDLEAYRRESGYIRAGIQLLLDSRRVAQTLASRAALGSWAALDARAAPWDVGFE
jgi:hypothetical protein